MIHNLLATEIVVAPCGAPRRTYGLSVLVFEAHGTTDDIYGRLRSGGVVPLDSLRSSFQNRLCCLTAMPEQRVYGIFRCPDLFLHSFGPGILEAYRFVEDRVSWRSVGVYNIIAQTLELIVVAGFDALCEPGFYLCVLAYLE